MTKFKYFGNMCKKLVGNVYFSNRDSEKEWLTCWSKEELDWAIKHNFMQLSEPMLHLGESSNKKYYEYTPMGKRLKDYYTYTTWMWIKSLFKPNPITFYNKVKQS